MLQKKKKKIATVPRALFNTVESQQNSKPITGVEPTRRRAYIPCTQFLGNAGFFCEKFDKICQRLCEFGSKIEELEPTKLETDHGAGTYSSTRIYFVYVIFGKRGFFLRKI